ncbi:MAG: hypothetical protein PHU25_11600 [Deltaproteobacteria bacterium]|nr:hypothetical protein [Deltaproteobacteria bacterium]
MSLFQLLSNALIQSFSCRMFSMSNHMVHWSPTPSWFESNWNLGG